MPPKLTQYDIDIVARAIERGVSITIVADLLNVSRSAVHETLVRRYKCDPDQWRRLLDYLSGIGSDEIWRSAPDAYIALVRLYEAGAKPVR